MLTVIGNIGAWAGAIAATLFVVGYHASARWWKTPEGRHMMAFTAAMALLLDYSGVRLLMNPPHVPHEVRVTRAVVFWIVAGLLVWRLQLLYRLQIHPVLRRWSQARRGR